MSKSKKKQSRTYGLIIPSDWENARAIVLKAKAVAKYYYFIEHARDVYSSDGEHGMAGELKNKHIHLLFTFNSSRDLGTVQNYFSEFPELRKNSFELIRNAFGAKRYLIHADNPEKTQYDVLEVESNDKCFSNVFIEKMAGDAEVKLMNANYKVRKGETMEEYIDRHLPLLLNLNTYGKFIVMRGLRKDWHWQNEVGNLLKDKKADVKNRFDEISEITDSFYDDLPF
jgi:hypothetical protein